MPEIVKPAQIYIGKYVFFYTPMHPKMPLFIDPKGAKAVKIKAQRQFWVDAVFPNEELDITFTRVGEHIAITCDTLDQYKDTRKKLEDLQLQWKTLVKDTNFSIGSILGKTVQLDIHPKH